MSLLKERRIGDPVLPDSPEAKAQTLRRLRGAWALSLASCVLFAAVTLLGIGGAPGAGAGAASGGAGDLPVQQAAGGFPSAVWVPLGLLLFGVPVAYFIRLQMYKGGWVQDAVQRDAYFAGNVVVFGALTLCVFAGLVVSGVPGAQVPALSIAAAGFLGLLLNFPSGGPMQPAAPL